MGGDLPATRLRGEPTFVRSMARQEFMALLLLYSRWQRNRSSSACRIHPSVESTRVAITVTGQTTYLVRNAEGHVKAKHHRIGNSDGSKRVWWEMPDGSKGLNGTPSADLPLYGSQLVQDWHTDDLVIITEGEKAAQALLDAGLLALGTVTGASSTPGQEALDVLRDCRVCLWPDNDGPGRNHMERIAGRLDGVAAE